MSGFRKSGHILYSVPYSKKALAVKYFGEFGELQ